MSNLKIQAFLALQYALPHHLLSRLTGWLAECRLSWLKNVLINLFVKHYGVNMEEALQQDTSMYTHFNAFFTRKLRPGAREFDLSEGSVVSPVDGTISQIGRLNEAQLLQAKSHTYSLQQLLAGDEQMAKQFLNGLYTTIYLAPRDYHRIHMPITGVLKKSIYVPGKLFSVSPLTAEHIPGLFAKNERLICEFDTSVGPLVMILVGAMIVAGIETVWGGNYKPNPDKLEIQTFDTQIKLNAGEELGRFKLGSTVIVLAPAQALEWSQTLKTNTPLKLGQKIGKSDKIIVDS